MVTVYTNPVLILLISIISIPHTVSLTKKLAPIFWLLDITIDNRFPIYQFQTGTESAEELVEGRTVDNTHRYQLLYKDFQPDLPGQLLQLYTQTAARGRSHGYKKKEN